MQQRLLHHFCEGETNCPRLGDPAAPVPSAPDYSDLVPRRGGAPMAEEALAAAAPAVEAPAAGAPVAPLAPVPREGAPARASTRRRPAVLAPARMAARAATYAAYIL
jgi:hypothetical protein